VIEELQVPPETLFENDAPLVVEQAPNGPPGTDPVNEKLIGPGAAVTPRYTEEELEVNPEVEHPTTHR
jgi:hypothetical protein